MYLIWATVKCSFLPLSPYQEQDGRANNICENKARIQTNVDSYFPCPLLGPFWKGARIMQNSFLFPLELIDLFSSQPIANERKICSFKLDWSWKIDLTAKAWAPPTINSYRSLRNCQSPIFDISDLEIGNS